MLKLHDNAFSPFARKLRMALDHKGQAYEVVDGLRKSAHATLAAVNGRVEVPALEHDGLLVVNSADIIAYLERRFPQAPLYPADHAGWVQARAWERCSDSVIDPILIDISYWGWAERADQMPAGMKQAAQRDLDAVYAALERDLQGGDYVCGALSVADLALFPHLVSTRALGVAHDPQRFPCLDAWLRRMRGLDVCKSDIERARTYVADTLRGSPDLERRKIFWRGERIEWVLARGYHEWFLREIREDRVMWPGLGIPALRGRA